MSVFPSNFCEIFYDITIYSHFHRTYSKSRVDLPTLFNYLSDLDKKIYIDIYGNDSVLNYRNLGYLLRYYTTGDKCFNMIFEQNKVPTLFIIRDFNPAFDYLVCNSWCFAFTLKDDILKILDAIIENNCMFYKCTIYVDFKNIQEKIPMSLKYSDFKILLIRLEGNVERYVEAYYLKELYGDYLLES